MMLFNYICNPSQVIQMNQQQILVMKRELNIFDNEEKKTYMLILEGTFSDDITTTAKSFQEDPYNSKQCQNKKE